VILGDLAELLGLDHRPGELENVPVVHGDVPTRPLARGEPFTVVSWNIQYAAGRHHFFYDGGPTVSVPPDDVHRTLDGIGAALRDADLALVQEIDRDSRRTGRIDELVALADGWGTWASAPYHRSAYVPVPRHEPLGRIDLHLALLSRFPLAHARRTALPALRESRLRRALNLKRAVLSAEIPFEGGNLAVAVTHLSAWSRGDGTLAKQVEVLAAWMEARERAGQPFVLAGDLNLLPPGDDPSRLPDPTEYADHPNPIERLIPRFRSVIPPERLLDPSSRTYQPFDGAPQRLLDYMFVSDAIEVRSAAPDPTDLSDHLPLRATLVLR
jgi:endonuclease/exonuclease/phosphatase family metal-dependent hydrolase